MGEVVLARTSPTLHPPSPPTVHQLLQLELKESIRELSVYDSNRADQRKHGGMKE